MNELEKTLQELKSKSRALPFGELPDEPNVLYAVWVDDSGADELSAVTPDPIAPGIIYVGECVVQTPRRHLASRDIGSLTLMKNLAALFREPWGLTATGRGSRLLEPGRTKLREWMGTHLRATVAPRHPGAPTKQVLSLIDPPLRIEGWRPERTNLRRLLTEQRAELDRA